MKEKLTVWSKLQITIYVFIWLCCFGFCSCELRHKKTGELFMTLPSIWDMF